MFKKVKKIWNSLGPGLVTGASDDDPSGIATYSQAGAKFGLNTLWTAWVSLPLMIVVLEMFARLSIVSSRGLAHNLKKFYPKWFLYVVIVITFPAIVFNIGADLSGMGAIAQLLFPAIPRQVFSLIFTILLIVGLIFLSYERIASLLKWLCLGLMVYFVVPFMVEQSWKNVFFASIVPNIEWGREYLYILVAIIGTTISPYLFFWQSAMSLEHKNHREEELSAKKEKNEMQADIFVGMIASNAVMYFIMLTTASVLYPAGIQDIDTVEQAAQALQPLAGNWAYFLFALGVIGTGFLAIPVLAGSISYFFSDTFEWQGSMDKRWHEAKHFYSVMAGAIILGFLFSVLDFNPVQSLIYTAVIYGLTCPIFIGLILHMCNSKKIMHNFTNGWCANFFGFLAFLLTSAAAIALIVMLFIPKYIQKTDF